MRRLLDSVDVCQSVFAKFFARIAEGDYVLRTPKQLLRLLITMANNKMLDHHRKSAAARHGGGRTNLGGDAIEAVADPSQSPVSAVESRELVGLLRGRLSPEEQTLLDEWMLGNDWEGIASRVSSTLEAVRKRFTRAIDRAAEELGFGESA